MWFSLPKGCSRISVECIEFAAEVKDNNGVEYFRAPEHFAPRILAIAGFSRADPPEGSPEDLPRADPLRDNAIVELTQTVEMHKREIQNLREDAGANTAKIIALSNENTDLRQKLAVAQVKIDELNEVIEDAPTLAPEVLQLRKAK